MIAYGLCNLVGSFFQSYVVAGGFARSAVNAEGGAQTPLAGLISGVCILISLQFFTSLFYYLPLSTLGAIIVVSVVSMMDFQKVLFAYRKGFYQDFVIIIGSLLSTFFCGVAIGLLCGIALSVGRMLYSTSFAEFDTDTGGSHNHDGASGLKPVMQEEREKEIDSGEVLHLDWPTSNNQAAPLGSFRILRMSALLYFGNLDNFKDSVQEASRSLIQTLRQHTFLPRCSTTFTAVTCIFGAVVVDASTWGHYLELPSASALDELRLSLGTPKPLVVTSHPPPLSSTSTSSASPSSLSVPPLESCHCDSGGATIVVKLGLVNCHPSVLKLLAALGIVEKIGIDMIFSSTTDCLQHCDRRLQLMMCNHRDVEEKNLIACAQREHLSDDGCRGEADKKLSTVRDDVTLDDNDGTDVTTMMSVPPQPQSLTVTTNHTHIEYVKIPVPTQDSVSHVSCDDRPEEFL